jgi:hypothetical protein
MWSLSEWLSTSASKRKPHARNIGSTTRWPASVSRE